MSAERFTYENGAPKPLEAPNTLQTRTSRASPAHLLLPAACECVSSATAAFGRSLFKARVDSGRPRVGLVEAKASKRPRKASKFGVLWPVGSLGGQEVRLQAAGRRHGGAELRASKSI